MREKYVGSTYLGLINSNVSLNHSTPAKLEKVKKFIEGIKRLFLSSNILNMIEIKDPEDEGIPKDKLIQRINMEVYPEVGPEEGFVHVHYKVQIFHRTTLRLDCNRIANFFKNLYHMSVYAAPPKIISDRSVSMFNYGIKGRKKQGKLVIRSQIEGLDEIPGIDDEDFLSYSRAVE